MREIKFRGKSDDEWVYGMLMRTNDFDTEHGEDWKYTIQTDEKEMGEYNRYFITDSNTIGQFTGLKDKNGVEIYEGDIVYVASEDENAKITWCEEACKFILEFDSDWISDFDSFYGKELEVIGNIYDNPELIEKEGK